MKSSIQTGFNKQLKQALPLIIGTVLLVACSDSKDDGFGFDDLAQIVNTDQVELLVLTKQAAI